MLHMDFDPGLQGNIAYLPLYDPLQDQSISSNESLGL